MLYYGITDRSEEIDLAKRNNRKECVICHNWFFNYRFEFQDTVCNDFHYLTMLSVNVNNVAIILI